MNKHLASTATLAERLASEAQPGDMAFQRVARAAGLLHDIGKYTDKFQDRIRGAKISAPHSAYGAAIAAQFKCGEAALAIAGHHSGLADTRDGTLQERIHEAESEIGALIARARRDFTTVSECFGPEPLLSKLSGGGSADLRTRMLFSCLIDADRLDSSGRDRKQAPLLAAKLLSSLLGEIEKRAAKVPAGVVKDARRRVLEACLAAAERPERLLSLTVPTGGGKTLASVAFALKKALLSPAEVRRIIVVIPYLSIIEQNAQALIDAFGAESVLEHHSGSHYRLTRGGWGEDERFFPEEVSSETGYDNPLTQTGTENWDAPVVVTTSVRFFESMFSNHPRDLRRMHNVARSVVILDEVQTLPRDLLAPSLAMMRELAEHWTTTFLFCTATQPAFEKGPGALATDPRWEPGGITEVMPAPAALFRELRRVTVDTSDLAKPLGWTEVARRMLAERAALAIVNVRDHAARLYTELRVNATECGIPADALIHLSTRMCGAHRLETIARIKSRIEQNKPCFVASTQLVEAGVDLDFPVVFRALGPLDSIAQAAGRCDREGKLTAEAGVPAGRVIVFRTEDGKTPPGAYKEATDRTQAMFMAGEASIDDPNSLRRYFERCYGEGADLGGNFLVWRNVGQFRTIAKEYHMIEDGLTIDVFVPYRDTGRELIGELGAVGTLKDDLRRRLQRYVVSLRPSEFSAAQGWAIRRLRPDEEIWICKQEAYDEDLGFRTSLAAGDMRSE